VEYAPVAPNPGPQNGSKEKDYDRILLWEKSLVGLMCEPTTPEEVKKLDLRHRLLRTCVRYNGVGVAAPQIGINLQVALVNYEDTLRLLINPEILPVGSRVGRSVCLEGCLSLPGASASGNRVMNRGRVERPDEITVQYLDDSGETKIEVFKDFVAHIVLHEINHLSGAFFIEHVGKISRSLIMDRFENFKRHHAYEV
jgi:peptide deformylase